MADGQTAVLLLGTGHWGNPGKDFKSVTFDDMLSSVRQEEIQAGLEQLMRFAPTKVALEILPSHEDEWNDDYAAYRQGAYSLTADERHQLGFRLAAMAGCPRIYGIDWHDFERPIGWERALAFAQEHGQEQFIPFFTATTQETAQDKAAERERIRQTSVREQLLGTNAPDALAASHRVYMDLAQVGEDDTYIGAEVVLR